jgi:hypothetical protein
MTPVGPDHILTGLAQAIGWLPAACLTCVEGAALLLPVVSPAKRLC